MAYYPRPNSRKSILIFLVNFGIGATCFAQTIRGTVVDLSNNPLEAAGVVITGTSIGAGTDSDGKFEITVDKLPTSLTISYQGFEIQTISISDASKPITIILEEESTTFNAAVVKADRVSEKQKESPLTVESLGIKAIQDAPAASFYESLGNLKGVDITAASLGFRVVNTRGFNSTSPVRSLQIIDGVDNQSPGLNFSLGNFLGASDLDIRRVDIIAGASSAFYGPNAFNGVISMETKSPFMYQGLTAEVKSGERNLNQLAVRWAEGFKLGGDKDRLAFKIGVFYMQANDWEAKNYNPTETSKVGADNPGGYDAINIYGDEYSTSDDAVSSTTKQKYPGLGYYHRTGYKEEDLVDYHTENLKLNTAIHYKIKDSLELIYALNFSSGSTVYQGDNRYRLQDIKFWQNRVELRKEDKFFLRMYTTGEDAGNTYDIVSTAFRLNDRSKTDIDWVTAYRSAWVQGGNSYARQVKKLPGYVEYNPTAHGSFDNWAENYYDPFIEKYRDSLVGWHDLNRGFIDASTAAGALPRPMEGSARFDSLFNVITSSLFTENGTRFYDRSSLYHMHGEYTFSASNIDFTTGVSGRLYRPDSRGTILKDTGDVVIRNHEFGLYVGADKRFLDDRLKFNFTARLDKNQNFDFLFSPAASLIYRQSSKSTFRASFSSAIRNPTLADQYLYYNVGRALLLGNLNGIDSLITIPSFTSYRTGLNIDTIEYFSVDAIRPEKAKTFEIGYKGSLFDNSFFVDGSYYLTFYQDFIGYNVGLDTKFDPATRLPGPIQVYRVAANAKEVVTTQGFAITLSYYYKKYAVTGNYSWNVLNKKGTDDPIIPAFNTPEHKFNLGYSGRRIKLPFLKDESFGFGINYKWIQGFTFEGSPQFTGFVPTYDMVDAQVNYEFIKQHTTVKIGGSNLLGLMPLFDGNKEDNRGVFNNLNYQVYGGPNIGRLAYVSVTVQLDPPKPK
jgi:iron complex outermembrane receptor protein